MIKTIETIAQLGVVLVVWYLLHYLLKVFNVALEDDTNESKEKTKNDCKYFLFKSFKYFSNIF